MVDRCHPELLLLSQRLPPEANLEAGLAAAARLAKALAQEVVDVLPGATNCLVLATRDDLVLRVPLVDEESGPGYRAQLAFSGRGGVEVLAHDDETGSTLMPRLRPGRMLHEVTTDPAEEARVCAGVIRSLDHPPIPGAIAIESWYEPFMAVRSAEEIPDDLLQEAQRLAEGLLASTATKRLVHGDLHHYNLLQHDEGWVAIDPKGVAADPVVEIAAFLRNPCATILPTPTLMSERIRVFAEELGYPASRIRDWGVAHNVLSAWWDPPEQRPRTIRAVEAIRGASI